MREPSARDVARPAGDDPVLGDATPAEAGAIVGLFRDAFAGAFEAELLDVMIHGAEGASRWVEDQLQAGPRSSARFAVARAGGRVAAAADLRVRPPVLFLSYVAVAPWAEGRGLGRALLRRELARARAEGLRRFELDVFATNVRAVRLYEAMGLRTVSERGLWIRPLPRPGAAAGEPAPRAVAHDLPQADVVHARFGFSELSIAVGEREHRVGRLGRRFFRLPPGADAAGDAALLGALAALDPSREALAAVEGATRPDALPGWRLLVVSRRMSGALDQLSP